MSKKSSSKGQSSSKGLSSSKGQSSSKGGGKKKEGKRRIVIQLPPGSTLGTMSEDEITKLVHDLGGKTGLTKRHVGGGVDELQVEVADSSSPNTLAPPDGWAARWSRKCAL